MKSRFFVAAGAVALAAGAAGAAHAGSTVADGYVGLQYTYSSISSHETDTETCTSDNENGCFEEQDTTVESFADRLTDNLSTLSVNGAVALPVTDLIGAQADMGVGFTSISGHENDSEGSVPQRGNLSQFYATGHAFARTERGTVGVFFGGENLAGHDRFNFGEGDFENEPIHMQMYGGGIEGQYYLDRLTLQAATGVATLSDSGLTSEVSQITSNSPIIWTVRGEARYFITDNFDVQANVGYMDGSWDLHGDFEGETIHGSTRGPGLVTVGVSGEYKFGSSPFTLIAGYEHGSGAVNAEAGFDSEGTTFVDRSHIKVNGDSFTIGVRWTFGGSLFDRDRHGASLDDFRDDFGGDVGADALTTDFGPAPDLGPI